MVRVLVSIISRIHWYKLFPEVGGIQNWQTEYHIQNWKIINERPYVWASFVWNMFDFGAAHRTEGDRLGINDKGLVTHDRKIKKDAYYFYRANWNPEPMIYIAGRRNVNRVKPLVDVQVFRM